MEGFDSLSEQGSKVPVTILRDSGASQSVLLEGVLPLSDESSAHSRALIQGTGMNFIGVPPHAIQLESDLVKGRVVVGVKSKLPVSDVSFILGNDLAGGKILLNPEVVAVPVIQQPDDLRKKFLNVFPVCAVTRAMVAKQGHKAADDDAVVDLSESFLVDGNGSSLLTSPAPFEAAAVSAEGHCSESQNSKVRMSRQQLIIEQKRDLSLAAPFKEAVTGEEADTVAVGYVLKDGVLVRKWTPRSSSTGDWRTVTQIVVPKPFRGDVLRLKHDDPLAGHLGANKTYERVLRCFFWPGLQRDVRQHCKTCHVCQVCRKPNQTISPYPLYPIPVMGEPFEHIIIDCVGPLPRTRCETNSC